MSRKIASALVALLLATGAPAVAFAQASPATWDDLVHVNTRKFDQVFLLPGADFRGFRKVMLDPTEVAFHRNFERNSSRSINNRVTAADVRRLTDEVQSGFGSTFTTVFEAAGYQVVATPGPDVLRLRTAVANLFISAPDTRGSTRSRTYSRNAGQATLVLEARDSETGELLGRAVDHRIAGDMGPLVRNRVTNRADFQRVFRTWAQTSANGLAQLKELSPID